MTKTPGRTYYYVYTYDAEKQEFTPQKGIKCGRYSQFGLRKALRALRQIGYDVHRAAAVSVYVEKRA